MIVFIRDTMTAEIRQYRYPYPWDSASEYLWSEGNYSCDCNRALFFAEAHGENDPDRDCGDERYVLKIVSDDSSEELYQDDGWTEETTVLSPPNAEN